MIYPEIKAKGNPDFTPLVSHLQHVAIVAEKLSAALGSDPVVARYGAILHDIGKAHPEFQKRLVTKPKPEDKPFRHEITSCLFISLFEVKIQPALLEMVIAHHKSIRRDARDKGLLDLIEYFGSDDVCKYHTGNWEDWSPKALDILSVSGVRVRPLTISEAEENFSNLISFCKGVFMERGYSVNRGILQASDHFASSLGDHTEKYSARLFRYPDLEFFNRSHELYPLSLKPADSDKPHTMVVACTGAGKTDFLLRRCRGRVFYTLPFQASINAMFNRLSGDLTKDNPDLDIRILHSASSLSIKDRSIEEKILQGHVGSTIKILTPHQVAGIVFGTNGYEATLVDIKGCDVILDEIHSYTNITRAIVLKIVHVLKELGCRVHIGSATIPASLYQKILDLLGPENVHQVRLSDEELDNFDRHIVHKISHWDNAYPLISSAIEEGKKVLLVCNRVQSAQQVYSRIRKLYPETPSILLHSRFKRGTREKKEKLLLGKDNNGFAIGQFNTSAEACIVVSTQVVEVSLDISFDIMVTECAPLDSLIQRFGRINRARHEKTRGLLKPVYIIEPPANCDEAKPYELSILKDSYNQLPSGDCLHERDLQKKIDAVFPSVEMPEIEEHAIFKNNGEWTINKLTHRSKSFLLDKLEIDSVTCIVESDEGAYLKSGYEQRIQLEIPVRYWSVFKNRQITDGNRPFIVCDSAYTEESGLMQECLRNSNTDTNFQIY